MRNNVLVRYSGPNCTYIYQAKLRIQIRDRRPEERPAVLASRTHGGVRRRGRRSRGQCARVGTLQVSSVRESLEGLAFHPVCTTACPLKGKHVATPLIRGVRRLRSAKEPQLMVRLPARMRTGLKHGHGPLEDRVVVLGRFEVNDVPRGIALRSRGATSVPAPAGRTRSLYGFALSR